jgi:DNA-binding NarL/FixJ family response regulator
VPFHTDPYFLPGESGKEKLCQDLHTDPDFPIFRSGYLVKGTPAPQILQAIRAIVGGETPISPSVARHLIANFYQADAATATDPEDAMTPREELVLQKFAHGQTYEQIAAVMSISVHTVHSHIRKVYGKLHVNSRREALRLVRERGYFRANGED